MSGLFLTFEGGEGCGKSTQVGRLLERLRSAGYHDALALREPGGTAIGEEIRHTLQYSKDNAAMTPAAELLLMNASRAQLVREVIRPALAAGRIVVCDRFYDSTVAYQGYGRGLDLDRVREVIDFAVGDTRPDLTIYLRVTPSVSSARLQARRASSPARDRFEEADDGFFERVVRGYEAIAAAEPGRVQAVDADGAVNTVSEAIWHLVRPRLPIAA